MSPNSDVTAVVCTWNAAQTIEENLISLVGSNVGSIILVDADSEDDTVQIASKYCDKNLKLYTPIIWKWVRGRLLIAFV